MARLFVVSAPSGAGKTTLCRKLLDQTPGLGYSVSYTTRPPRPGEEDGRDYFFVSRDRFTEMIGAGDFLEWAEVFGRFYGTGREWVASQLERGYDILVDVDIAGARQIKDNFPEAVLVFIVPPTLDELGRRLKSRNTESAEQLKIRLDRVKDEIAASAFYDFLVINDEIDRALMDLSAIVRSERLRFSNAGDFWPRFFNG